MRIGNIPPTASGQPVAEKPGEFPAVGETIETEVISDHTDTSAEHGGRLTLRSADGTVFSARAAKPLTASPGDTLRLTVTGRGDGMLLVERADENPTPRAALRQLGALASIHNLRLAAALTASRLPVTAQVWEKLGKALSAFPELTAEQAVFMLEYQVPVNKRNVMLFQQMDKQEHQLTAQLFKLEAMLTGEIKIAGHMPQETLTQLAVTDYDETTSTSSSVFVQIPDSENTQPLAHLPASKPQYMTVAEDRVIALPPEPDIPIHGKPAEPMLTAPQTQQAQTTQTQLAAPPQELAAGTPQVQPKELLSAHPIELPQAQTVASPRTQSSELPQTQPNGLPQAQFAEPQQTKPPEPPQTRSDPLPQTHPAGQPALLINEKPARTPVTVSDPEHIVPHSPSITSGTPRSTSALSALRDKVTGLFRQVRSAQSQTAAEQLNAAKLGRDIAGTLRDVADRAAALSPGRREDILSLVREISEGVRFAQQLEHFATVVQWPLTIGGQPAQAEMYVFQDGAGQKRINPHDATLFLSLNTAHLGRVETLARVIGKNIECDFRLASEECVGAVRDGAEVLRGLLGQSGYNLTRSSFDKQNKPAAEPLAIRAAKENFSRRYNFEAQI